MMLGRCNCNTATIKDNKLILTLSNAMTPVMWVIDMGATNTFLMRVETTENGLYVLQKISPDGKLVEDIAFYNNKGSAINALNRISRTLNSSQNKNNGHSSLLSTIFSTIKNIVLVLLLLIFIIFGYVLFEPVISLLSIGSGQTSQSEMQNQPSSVTNDTNAVGVPMSADAYLEEQSNGFFPF